MRKLYMIGNTHFDPVWLWKWDEAMASIRATFRSALDRMKEDENFTYSFATPPVFEWIKNTDPEMYYEIKMRIKEGRWDIAEGWWVQPDCYSASGESYVRQGLYAQKYLSENFGKTTDCVFNIDSFGHSPNFPQILKKSRISCYCFVRPEKHHIALEHPLFNWEGTDGSKILAYRAEDAYSKNLAECIENQTEKEQDILIVYGVTDHGGAPTKKMIAEINAMDNAEFSSVSRFFKEHSDCTYTVKDELLTGDFGPYSNYPTIKKYNRLAEYAALNAEKSSVFAENYSSEKIESCWHDILFNQFHDILGGACIKEAYFDAENSFGRAIQTANEITHFNLQKITAKMKTVGKNPDDIWNLVIWNLNGAEFDGYLEAEVQWAHEFDWYDKGIALADADGNIYPCQIIDSKSVIPQFRSRFTFKAKIPSCGYKMFKVVKTGEDETIRETDPYSFSTARLSVNFAKDGSLCITKKNSGKILYNNPLKPVAYFDDGDTWAFNISGYAEKGEPFVLSDLRVLESGKIRTVIKATYKFKSSILHMYYTFYENEEYFDVKYVVNWNEKHYVLKFNTKVTSEKHTAGAPYSKVVHSAATADVPMSLWVSTSSASFIADGIFSYNMVNNTLGLTVLRSPIYGDLRLGEIDYDHEYDIISQGITEGNIRVMPHAPELSDADNFVNKPIIIDECNHDGYLPFENSYLAAEGIYLGALKKCEFDDSVIIRVFESCGENKTAEIRFGKTNFNVTLTPFEIKTFKIKDGAATEIYMTEDGEFKC